MTKKLSWLGVACGLWVAGCALDDDAVSGSEQAIYGAEGDHEFAIDAPWRIEPTMPGFDYGQIPITISIHDAHLKGEYDDLATGEITVNGVVLARLERALGRVKALRITELGVGTFDIPLGELHEVERTLGAWPFPSGTNPPHELCRRWAGESCATSPIMEVSDASEWHATVFYTPRGPRTPGRDIRLDLELTVSQVNRFEAQYPGFTFDDARLFNQVAVHLGEAPLPRFDDTTWAYGDLHYHSQGTDNEGESAYGYRGVLHAMAALGLDFALAAEHASDSEQMVDLDLPPDAVFSERFSGLRDMNDARYGHLWHWLHNVDGANRELRSSPRLVSPTRHRVPQLYLGGEVDVVPETIAGEYLIGYGNGKTYDIREACGRLPIAAPFDTLFCDSTSVREDTADGRWIVRDPQSMSIAAARQHLLYLPRSATGNAGFISSESTKYGGGRFRLKDLVRDNFELDNQGSFFLAHPNEAASETGFASLGPDIVPYSQAQYDDLFGSRSFLGLQFWNSDGRRTIDARFELNKLGLWTGGDTAWQRAPDAPGLFDDLHHGAATWDRLLLAGMDPARTAQVPWLAPGEPRRFFMAGGSDAHGDLNFRRKGYMTTVDYFKEDIDDVTDTAMGTPRNLVRAGTPAGNALVAGIESSPFTQDQVFGAMARGEFAVTDGPALRIVWDVNENRAIDNADVPMGGAITYDPQAGPPTLLVEWKSTAEFGELDKLQLYVGAAAGSRGVVYAPAQHGVRQVGDDGLRTGLPAGNFRDELTNLDVTSLDDGYWQDQRLELATAGQPMAGVAAFKLRPSSFRVGAKGLRVCRTLPTGVRECYRRFENPVDPEHLYVRAFAKTKGRQGGAACPTDPVAAELERRVGRCIPRLAFTNPVWARPAHPMRASTLVSTGGKCLDVLGGNTQNAAVVGIWSCNGSGMQQWIYDNVRLSFVGWVSKALDALGWQNFEGALVGMWDRNGAWNQQWTFAGVQVRGLEGKHLDIAGGGTHEGVSTILASGDGSTRQTWTLTPAGEIRSWDNRCLDVYGHWTHDGAPVLVYSCWGTANQKWKVLPGGMLQGVESGKCLAAQADSAATGTPLVLAACTGTAAQRWSFRGPIRAWNGKCLDVYGGYNTDGTRVLLYTCHGGANQQWIFYP